MKVLLIILLLFVGSYAQAQDLLDVMPEEHQLLEKSATIDNSLPIDSKENLDSWLNKDLYLASGYQQQSYVLKDIQGDIALLGFARTNMKRIKLMIKKDKEGLRELISLQKDGFNRYKDQYNQWTFNPLDPFPVSTVLTEERIDSFNISEESKKILKEKALDQDIGFELKSKAFVSRKVVNMMTQVIQDEYYQSGIEPKLGKEHTFASETYAFYKKEYPVLKSGMTKLFMALGNGLTFRFMVTDKEHALAEIIESRPYESVTLADAFRWSYRLNEGDVYLTLLTLENLFAYHWTNPKRDQVAVVQRLKQFTHYFNKGDKFGHWYHFWGMVLYGHVRGAARASVVGAIEELLSRLAGGEENQENQEGRVNVGGGLVGGKLNKMLRSKGYLKEKFDSNPEYLNESYYLEPMDLDRAIKKHFE
ncbi:MAG: hypothetical protein K2P81_09700 [Bacteriovoracaceae bacterium]|nr:hypothetical protein [Bacteriovoracaceae bacterium]